MSYLIVQLEKKNYSAGEKKRCPSGPNKFTIFCIVVQVLTREVKNVPTSSLEEPGAMLLYFSGSDIPLEINPGWPHPRKMLFPKKLTLLLSMHF